MEPVYRGPVLASRPAAPLLLVEYQRCGLVAGPAHQPTASVSDKLGIRLNNQTFFAQNISQIGPQNITANTPNGKINIFTNRMNSCLNHFSSSHPHPLLPVCISMSRLLTLQHVIVVLSLVQQPFTVVINRCMSRLVSWEIQPAVRGVDMLQMHYSEWRMWQKKVIHTPSPGFYPPCPVSSSLSLSSSLFIISPFSAVCLISVSSDFCALGFLWSLFSCCQHKSEQRWTQQKAG